MARLAMLVLLLLASQALAQDGPPSPPAAPATPPDPAPFPSPPLPTPPSPTVPFTYISVAAHGTMMALAWGAFFPAAQLCARFLKGKGRLSLLTHAGFNSVGLIFFIAGFALANKYVSAQGGSHYDGPHQKMGLALFILVWFQFAAGVFRPKHPVDGAQPSKLRSLWEKVHPRSGRVLQILGFITAFAGTIVARSMPGVNTSALTAGSVFWVLWVLLLAFGFYKLEQRNRTKLAAAAATVTEAGGGKRWYQLG